MNLEELARTAADELRAGSRPDPAVLFDDLRRTRSRRNAVRTAVVVAVCLLVVGGAALVRADHHDAVPAHPGPAEVSNGAIVSGGVHGVSLVSGHLDHLPRHAATFTSVQFIADGTQLVYARRPGELAAMDVTTGATRDLAPCRPSECVFSQVSPDGTRVAVSAKVGGQYGVRIRTVGSGHTTFLPTDSTALGWLRWTPDGRSLVSSSAQGLELVPLDGSPVRLLDRYPAGAKNALPASVSPDGRTAAFLRPRPVADGTTSAAPNATGWTLMVVGLDGTGLRRLRDVGSCYCVGIAPPSVAWSPDGTQIAVTVIHDGRTVTDATSGGLFSIRPDGTGWTSLGSSTGVSTIAWQPLPHD